jgi:mannose-1-phosphate guanylyltransferase
MYALILAGGGGTRLWPYSRAGRPKQFLAIGGERTMLQQTLDRILPLVPPERVLIATGAVYAGLVAEQLPEVPAANVLLEPEGRSTAPCIGLAALHLLRRDPAAVMAVLSADHLIDQPEQLRAALALGERLAQRGELVTLGLAPTAPSSGYGYIRRGELLAHEDGLAVYRVAAFVEKPDAERAAAYLATGEYLWNGGMFVWRADRILEELRQHRPLVAAGLAAINDAHGTPDEQVALERAWAGIENVAIDVAVLERSNRAAVIPVELGRIDVGDWVAMGELLPRDADGNAVHGAHMGLDTRNTLVFSAAERLVVTIGVENLLVVDAGDVVLLCPRERAQEVRALVAEARRRHPEVG